MLVRLFRTSNPINYLLLPVVALLLRVPQFFISHSLPATGAFLVKPLPNFVSGYPIVSALLASLIVGLTGAFLNYLSDEFNFLDRVSGLTGFSYVIAASWYPAFATLTPGLLATLFVVAALHQLLLLSSRQRALAQVFNASALLAIASLFVPKIILLELLVLLGVLYFQSFHWRHISVMLIGAILPLLYFSVWGYPDGFFSFFEDYFSKLNPQVGLAQLVEYVQLLALLLFLVLWSAKSYLRGITSNTLRKRKTLLLVFWLLVLLIIASFQFTIPQHSPLVLLAIPISFMFSNYLYYAKKKQLAEIVVLLVLAFEIAAYWIY